MTSPNSDVAPGAPWWWIAWADGETPLGVNIVQGDDATHALIRANAMNITPDHGYAPGPNASDTCNDGDSHSWIWNPTSEMLECARCDAETPGSRQIYGESALAQLPPQRPIGDDATVPWTLCADRLLNQTQLVQLGLVTEQPA